MAPTAHPDAGRASGAPTAARDPTPPRRRRDPTPPRRGREPTSPRRRHRPDITAPTARPDATAPAARPDITAPVARPDAVAPAADQNTITPAPHTDIAGTGWVFRLPPRLRAYALLARLDRPIGTWLLLLPGWWGLLLGGGTPGRLAILFALFAAGALAMRSAGCVVNDMWDRDIDRQVERTRGRPLASGALGLAEAAVFLALLLTIALLVLLALRPLNWAMAAGSLVLVALYPLAKRVTWWPQLVMGLPFGFGAPMGYVAATGRFDAAAAALYAAAIAWDLGFDTVYGFQDMADDARVGVRSTSRRFAARARLFVGLAYAATVVLLALAMLAASYRPPSLLLLALPAALLARQLRRLDPASPALCLRLFRANREVGLAVAVALAAGRLL